MKSSLLFIEIIYLFFALIRSSNGDFICPNVDPVENFQPERIGGRWYDVGKIPSAYDKGLKCTEFECVVFPDKLKYTGRSIGIYYENEVTFDFYLIMEKDKNIAIFNCSLDEKRVKENFPIYLIATDYNSYQIYYSCNEDKEIELGWIMSRNRPVDENFMKKMYSILDANGIEWTAFVTYAQDDCSN